MKIHNAYKPRPIRFVEIYQRAGWTLKIYSISVCNERVSEHHIRLAKDSLEDWLQQAKASGMETYGLATLIIHEGKEGCFAVINWWTDENMLQNFVYLKKEGEEKFSLYSANGIATCVWEMAVWWHERNAWVQHVLKKNKAPDMKAYLGDQLNTDL